MKIFRHSVGMSSTKRLLAEIDAFTARTGMSESAFGQLSAGNRRLIKSLRSGRSVTLHTADAIRMFMRTYNKASVGNGGSRRRRSEARAA